MEGSSGVDAGDWFNHREDSNTMSANFALGIVIPTYKRGAIVIDSVRALLSLTTPPTEIVLVDQTERHPAEIESELQALQDAGLVNWLRLPQPSIPHAMNVGLQFAKAEVVLFLDDDIIPDRALVTRHLAAQQRASLVAGMVLQPGEQPESLEPGEQFRFTSDTAADIHEFMGGNFSVRRDMAIALGGFDENFIGAAYRFEAEFAWRYRKLHGLIRYEPGAVIHHLAVSSGGTRAHGHHLRTMNPAHSVGAYYFWLKTRQEGWWREMFLRPFRSIRTRHHLRNPWWIPLSLLAEVRGFLAALALIRRGPRLITLS
ncbi:glycosyltransferase family 2 protein [Thermomonas carbonis]|uniref:Glycosyltransferase family 2 protein n=1 Tax=Thermomonas carbonis TaxID=1463158 RepID=A0A7G9SN46_9GAMM|nr:glycosyltransferase [Thermomonas carbonis]QNN69271.1 glycosyltransferase family 2 protein [Thermomonas carbonis]GHC05580.1 hypothetical protein GCM10010080_19290 [Thermomonas carbonis]